ncbi:MAG: hypothetical protein JST93_26160 [Acidobacteria bacterium]|nr:hypothetical protein [Acidobacteriota bacterium]
MGYEPCDAEREAAEDAFYEAAYEQVGPQWAEDHGMYFYEDAVREFTAERLQSYYVAHPELAQAAHESLLYAESLRVSFPKAALIFAVTGTELAVKNVFLKPIVYGLVHTEGVAAFVTDLTTQHTGMERFQSLLAEILTQFGGVDLKTFKRADSLKTLWQEIGEVQKARNSVIHRGGPASDDDADLAIAVAGTLLTEILPDVLTKLGLHIHPPMTICGRPHPPEGSH